MVVLIYLFQVVVAQSLSIIGLSSPSIWYKTLADQRPSHIVDSWLLYYSLYFWWHEWTLMDAISQFETNATILGAGVIWTKLVLSCALKKRLLVRYSNLLRFFNKLMALFLI